MSDKKKNYAFSMTDTRSDTRYNVVWSWLWKIEANGGIVLPKSQPTPSAYAYNVFRENEGWIGGGSFVVLEGRPGQEEAMKALGIVLQHEVDFKATQGEAVEGIGEEVVVPAEDETVEKSDEEVAAAIADLPEDAVAVAGQTTTV